MTTKTHRAALITAPNSPFQIGEVPTKEPGYGEIRIKVSACGICATDHLSVEGLVPGITFTLETWTNGNLYKGKKCLLFGKLGKGWELDMLVAIAKYARDVLPGIPSLPTGLGRDGGWQEYLNVPIKVVVRIPEDNSQSDQEVAPLLCAGVTVFGALRDAKYKPGDVCIIQGIGGLGHLAIQYASRLGLRVFAVSNTTDKRELVQQLGAEDVWTTEEAVQKAQALGGAKVILATSPNVQSINALLPALAKKGQALVVGLGVDDEIKINTVFLVANKITVQGSVTGQISVHEDAVRFAMLKNVRAMVNTFPLEKIQEAYDEVMNGRPKFRNVILF
ncbi:alcohol dehydrogenase GroES domain protein [Atractiella rhizophila]|nr:alcohol dehydrogenase GroES domain protein [Atractiella rhizophila]